MAEPSVSSPIKIYEEYLLARGVTKKMADKLGWRLIMSRDPTQGVQNVVGPVGDATGSARDTPWLVIPYHDINGQPTGAESYRELVPAKPLFPTAEPPKCRRLSRKGHNSVDFSTLSPWSKLTPTTPIYIFESALKAAVAANAVGVFAIGLNGVYGWSNDGALRPELMEVAHENRPWRIVFDADVHVNRNVKRALNGLARKLEMQGCSVQWLELPEWTGEQLGKAAGFDDYVRLLGVKWAKEFLAGEGVPVVAGAHPLVAELNEQYAYDLQLNRIIEIHTGLHMTVRDFHNREANALWEDDEGKLRECSRSWMAWQGRTDIDRVVYDPTRSFGLVDTVWNKYRDERPAPAKKVKRWFADELLDNLCARNPVGRHDLARCVAWVLRHPEQRLKKLVALFGPQGCGKTTVGVLMSRVLGSNSAFIPADRVASRFNDFLAWKVFVMLEEPAKRSGVKKVELHNALQQLVTGDEYSIERKGLPVIQIENTLSLFISANDQDTVFVTKGDRRLAPILVDFGPTGERGNPWWKELYAWIYSEACAPEMMAWAERVDLTDFDPAVVFDNREVVNDIAGANERLIEEFAWEVSQPDFKFEDPTLAKEWARGRRLFTSEELVAEANARYRGEAELEYISPRNLGFALNNVRVPKAGKNDRVAKKVGGKTVSLRFRVLGADKENLCWQDNMFCCAHLDGVGFKWG